MAVWLGVGVVRGGMGDLQDARREARRITETVSRRYRLRLLKRDGNERSFIVFLSNHQTGIFVFRVPVPEKFHILVGEKG